MEGQRKMNPPRRVTFAAYEPGSVPANVEFAVQRARPAGETEEDPIEVSDTETAAQRPRRAPVVYSRWYHEHRRRSPSNNGGVRRTTNEKRCLAYVLTVLGIIDHYGPAAPEFRLAEMAQHVQQENWDMVRLPTLGQVMAVHQRKWTHNAPRTVTVNSVRMT